MSDALLFLIMLFGFVVCYLLLVGGVVYIINRSEK